MHCKLFGDGKTTNEIDIPPDIMMSIIPGLERLVLENRLHVDAAQTIITTHKVPLEIGQQLGLMAHSGAVQDHLLSQQQSFSQSASPLNHNNSNMPGAVDCLTNIHHFSGINSNALNCYNSANQQPPLYSFAMPGNITLRSADTSLNTSPMHQITRGISGLSTNSNEPLDLTMDSVNNIDMDNGNGNSQQWQQQMQNSYYVQQQQQQRTIALAATPPASPNNLCIIQEEHLPNQHHHQQQQQQFHQQQSDFIHLHHPQICLTDVQGSEITLVALSDSSSRESDDSLDTNNSNDTMRRSTSAVTSPSNSTKISMFHEFLIKEPSDDMPSITRGVGRKASLENEYNKQVNFSMASSSCVKVETDQFARRGSDKSLGFSDDSLSNDSNQSPAQEVSNSSGFKSTEEERLSPDSLSECRGSGSSEEYYELPLPNECRNLDHGSIMEIVKKQINSKMPPKGFIVNKTETDTRPGPSNQHHIPDDMSNMNLEYSGGLQIELKICERSVGGNSAMDIAGSKGIIKLRRISGDQNEYGKLCQQLLTSLTV